MLNWNYILVEAQCGDLGWLCCLGGPDKIRAILDLFSDATDAELERAYRYICSCATGARNTPSQTGPTAQGGAVNASACDTIARAYFCQGSGKAVMLGFSNAAGAFKTTMGMVPGMNIPQVSDPLQESVDASGRIIAKCSSGDKLTTDDLLPFCKLNDTLNTLVANLPDWAKPVAQTAIGALMPTDMMNVMHTCCQGTAGGAAQQGTNVVPPGGLPPGGPSAQTAPAAAPSSASPLAYANPTGKAINK